MNLNTFKLSLWAFGLMPAWAFVNYLVVPVTGDYYYDVAFLIQGALWAWVVLNLPSPRAAAAKNSGRDTP